MKLEFIPDCSADAPLLRLFAFDATQACGLRNALSGLASGAVRSIDIQDANFIQPIGNCRLTLGLANHDQGIMKTGEPATFHCSLTRGTWDNVVGLIEPFTEANAHGFQWLDRTNIPLLLSLDGQW